MTLKRFLAFTSPPAKWALANCWQAKLQVTHRLNHLLHLLTRPDSLSAQNDLTSSSTKWLRCNQRIVNYSTFQWLFCDPSSKIIFSNVYAREYAQNQNFDSQNCCKFVHLPKVTTSWICPRTGAVKFSLYYVGGTHFALLHQLKIHTGKEKKQWPICSRT